VSWIFLSVVRAAHWRRSLIPAIFSIPIGDDGRGVLAYSLALASALIFLLSEYVCTFARVYIPSCLFIFSYSR